LLSRKLREEALRRYGRACAICGADDVPLDVAYLVPIAAGGSNTIENLTILCPNHHRRMDRQGTLGEFEFVAYLAELLRLSPDFDNVEIDPVLSSKDRVLRPDLFAQERVPGRLENLYIECVPYHVLTDQRIDDVAARLISYRDATRDGTVVLALPGTLPDAATKQLTQSGIEVWDQPYLSQRFGQEVTQTERRLLRHLLTKTPPKKQTAEERLVRELRGCAPGRSDWLKYQKLVGRILEMLFCPPLSAPLPERSDALEINRRDYILPNYAEEGFWSFLRTNYHAHFVVADAKNYVRRVTKKEALQIANYLKLHGAGLFGLILSRKGYDRGCDFTLRELWAVHQKLVIVLTDSDIEQMLDAKSNGRPPEELIRQKIEDFRLSM